MSQNRKRLSGAQYRKISDAKKLKQEECLAKTRKIGEYFSSVEATPATCSHGGDVGVSSGTSDDEVVETIEKTEATPLLSGDDDAHVEPTTPVIDIDVTVTEPSNTIIEQPIDKSMKPYVAIEFRPSNDPAEWKVNDELRDYIAKFGLPTQNKANTYPESVREYSDCFRYMNNSLFKIILKNGEIVNREYVVYSKSTGKLFCASCLLYNEGRVTEGNQFITGFDDWKNVTKCQ